ncbi:MAG TPA: phosphoribosylglycinamide formyltransferase [Lysobacter sp.]|nr:phosphoribosylglycinamide formyltransferase [Lysobacter sp.]
MRLAVLVSGRGSNLQAILEATERGELDAEVVGVFSDKPDALALELASKAGIPAQTLRPRGFSSRGEYDEHLFSLVDAVQPDLIVCAGYMRLISDAAVAARLGRMINIHPSLLPAFKGLHTHQQALNAGVTIHGASVHYVTPELDGGPVIAQARVPVEAGDDALTLSARVLKREHPLLIATLQTIADDRVALVDNQVRYDGHALVTPLLLNDANQLIHG